MFSADDLFALPSTVIPTILEVDIQIDPEPALPNQEIILQQQEIVVESKIENEPIIIIAAENDKKISQIEQEIDQEMSSLTVEEKSKKETLPEKAIPASSDPEPPTRTPTTSFISSSMSKDQIISKLNSLSDSLDTKLVASLPDYLKIGSASSSPPSHYLTLSEIEARRELSSSHENVPTIPSSSPSSSPSTISSSPQKEEKPLPITPSSSATPTTTIVIEPQPNVSTKQQQSQPSSPPSTLRDSGPTSEITPTDVPTVLAPVSPHLPDNSFVTKVLSVDALKQPR